MLEAQPRVRGAGGAERPDGAAQGPDGAIAAFSELAAALSRGEPDLDGLLHLVCDKLCGLLGVARASLYLKDEESGQFRGQVARYHTDVDDQIKRYTAGVPADEFTREILKSKRPVLVANAQNDPRPVRAQMRRWGIRSMLGVPMIHADDVLGLVFLDNGEDPYPYTEAQQQLAQTFANLAAIAVSQSTDRRRLRANLATMASQNELLRRASVINDRLTALVLEGAGVSEIAHSVSDLAGQPCVVHDAARRRIAEAGGDAPAGALVSVLDERFAADPRVASATATLGSKRAAIVGPVPSAGLSRRFLVAPIVVRNETWGFLVLQERRSRFGQLDMLIAQRGAAIIALELVAARRSAELVFDSRKALLAELVRDHRDPEALQRRSRRLQLDLCRAHALLAVATRSGRPERLPTARELVTVLDDDGRVSDALAAEIGDELVLLAPLPGEEAGEEALRLVKHVVSEALRGLASDDQLLVGLSSPCSDPGEYGRALFETRQIITALREHSHPQGDTGGVLVLGSADLGSGRLLLASHTSGQLDRYLRDTFGRMLDPGNPAMLTLLRTLEVYFDEGRSTARTAAALGVHENTVRYRMARIVELAPIPLGDDGEAQLRAQLALLALRLRRKLQGATSDSA